MTRPPIFTPTRKQPGDLILIGAGAKARIEQQLFAALRARMMENGR